MTLSGVVWDKLVNLQFEKSKRVRKLDAETISLLRLADKVGFFLVTIGGVRPHLDLQDGVLWDCLDNGWKFPEVREALGERLSALRELHQEKATRLADRRLRRLNRVILRLTILGALIGVTSAVTFVQDNDGFHEWLCDRPGPFFVCETFDR